MITSEFAKRVFKDALERYGSLDAALTQVVAVAYRAGHNDAGGQVIYTDGRVDVVVTKHPDYEQHVGRCERNG